MTRRRLKELAGWLKSGRRAGRPAGIRYSDHVQSAPKDNTALRVFLTGDLRTRAGSRERYNLWIQMAARSDEAGWARLMKTDKALQKCERDYIKEGLIEEPYELPKVEHHTWQTKPQGIKQRTMRLVEKLRTRIVSEPSSGS